VEYEPSTKRHIFKTWEEVEEEQKPDSEKKPTKIQTEEPELSFNEWKKKFKEEHPGEKPTFQLYTIERLEKRKEQLIKELKKTSGVFKDKLNLRLTFTEALIEGYKKDIRVCEVGNSNEKLALEASDQELQEASYWAKVNRVVGFKEFKKMIASFVRGYNRLTEKKIDKPCQMYLLLGPPGVGKSFISEMLAEAMGLDIEVISMNGKKETSIFFGVPQE
jgi:ATP-dependent Clp protease ATP-binding subunit ClpA